MYAIRYIYLRTQANIYALSSGGGLTNYLAEHIKMNILGLLPLPREYSRFGTGAFVHESQRLQYIGFVVLYNRSIRHHLVHNVVGLLDVKHNLDGKSIGSVYVKSWRVLHQV